MDASPFTLAPKDFIETPDGFLFAVLSGVEESGRIPAYLRYRRTPKGLQKIATRDAEEILKAHGSRFYYESLSRAIRLQGIASDDLLKVYSARTRTLQIIREEPRDKVSQAARKLLRYLLDGSVCPDVMGVTGSLLIGAQTPQSDIDLVVYDRNAFERVRTRILEGIQTSILEDLSPEDWSEAHARRGASLTYEEYLRHEQRKGNKALIDGIKFDLTLINASQPDPEPAQSKGGTVDLWARVTDASDAYGFPARYLVDHPDIFEILAFSQTYAGQALVGERIWIRGRLERLHNGQQRIVVGQDREAHGEFIKRDEGKAP